MADESKWKPPGNGDDDEEEVDETVCSVLERFSGMDQQD